MALCVRRVVGVKIVAKVRGSVNELRRQLKWVEGRRQSMNHSPRSSTKQGLKNPQNQPLYRIPKLFRISQVAPANARTAKSIAIRSPRSSRVTPAPTSCRTWPATIAPSCRPWTTRTSAAPGVRWTTTRPASPAPTTSRNRIWSWRSSSTATPAPVSAKNPPPRHPQPRKCASSSSDDPVRHLRSREGTAPITPTMTSTPGRRSSTRSARWWPAWSTCAPAQEPLWGISPRRPRTCMPRTTHIRR